MSVLTALLTENADKTDKKTDSCLPCQNSSQFRASFNSDTSLMQTKNEKNRKFVSIVMESCQVCAESDCMQNLETYDDRTEKEKYETDTCSR